MSKWIRVRPKVNSDQFGTDEDYFKKFIKSKPLKVTDETKSGYIRVQDQNGEEWGLYSWQYLNSKAPKGKVLSDSKA